MQKSEKRNFERFIKQTSTIYVDSYRNTAAKKCMMLVSINLHHTQKMLVPLQYNQALDRSSTFCAVDFKKRRV